MWEKIKAWYMKTFLPFELEEKEEPTFIDEISDAVDDYFEVKKEGVGPNYGRKPFSKPATYKKWGNKWYKSDS
jgi:hypothetical protein